MPRRELAHPNPRPAPGLTRALEAPRGRTTRLSCRLLEVDAVTVIA